MQYRCTSKAAFISFYPLSSSSAAYAKPILLSSQPQEGTIRSAFMYSDFTFPTVLLVDFALLHYHYISLF